MCRSIFNDFLKNQGDEYILKQYINDIARSRLLSALMLLGMCSPAALAYGPGEVFIANYLDNSVTVYSRTASGTVVPRRVIRQGLSRPFGIHVDPLHAEIFVANNDTGGRVGSIQVYDLNANVPNDAPKRTIAGSATGLFACTGMGLDLYRQELYVTNDDTSTIAVFSRTANGNVAPLRTIAGPDTALAGPNSVFVDLLHDEIVVMNKIYYGGGTGRITVYPRASNGDVSPIRTIEGALPGFNLPVGMDVDLLHDEIAVANAFGNNVLVFRRTDNGDVAPTRTINGPSTGLCTPFGVVVDLLNNELVVANSGFQSGGCMQGTTVYTRTASGDATPKRSIVMGPAGGPPAPVTLAETLLSAQ